MGGWRDGQGGKVDRRRSRKRKGKSSREGASREGATREALTHTSPLPTRCSCISMPYRPPCPPSLPPTLLLSLPHRPWSSHSALVERIHPSTYTRTSSPPRLPPCSLPAPPGLAAAVERGAWEFSRAGARAWTRERWRARGEPRREQRFYAWGLDGAMGSLLRGRGCPREKPWWERRKGGQ